jgi:steroid delta-isomerase-like uncharacterized protein
MRGAWGRPQNGSIKQPEERTMSEQHKRLVRRLIDEVWSRGNFHVADELVAPDYVGHSSPMDSETHGPEGYKQFFSMLRSAFPDLDVTIEDQIAEGDRVATRWTARATHRGEFAGVPPSGKQGIVRGVSIYRLAGGTVAECWTNEDDLGLMMQIGGIPARAAAS